MPHQCTDCGRTFEDGSTEMLSGCPDCGGNKFQYRPDSGPTPREAGSETPPDRPADGSVTRAVGTAATAVRDLVGGSSSPDASGGERSPGRTPPDPREDAAQASARTDVVGPEELPPAPETPAAEHPPTEDPAGAPDEDRDRPDLAQLREELNDQFESIKVLEPGQYELNLMELYDREEYIIALQEDGKYTIQVPDRWREA